MSDDSSLHEKPAEFWTAMGQARGTCDAQAILPEDDHYEASCSCGVWRVQAPTRDDGLALARQHTGSPA